MSEKNEREKSKKKGVVLYVNEGWKKEIQREEE